MSTERVGPLAEARAAELLREAGLVVVGRNVRGPAGEIDLVARDGRTLVFVEVKARRTGACGPALAAVDARKRRRIRAAAADFVQIHAPGAAVRFDVVTVERGVVRHHRAAF